jgi:hypothetical protein
MATEKDLSSMIEVITTAIEIHGSEEDFFRRSSKASSNEAAKTLMLEIANDLGSYIKKLEDKRHSLNNELNSLQAKSIK